MSNDAPARPERLVHTAMTLLVFLCFLRAMIEHDPTPYWTHDPFRFAPPITGLSLGWATLYNAVLIFLSGVVLTRVPVPKPVLLLVLTATGFAISGVWILGDPENALGTSNAFALVSVVTAASGYFSVYPALLKPVLGYTLGFLCFQLCEGIHQYFVQHPQTVEYYETTKDTFLAARGWEPGSFQALSYERRLRQPEMLGWVQLSNVFAAMMGAGALGCGVLTMRAGRMARPVLGLLAVLCAGALAISGAKGAVGVTLLSLIAFAATRAAKLRIARGAALAAGGAIVIAGVVVGAQLGQLSLVFRTQYIRGAFSTLVHGAPTPIYGTGPARFQDLYQTHKPPNAPEDITSAHNVLVDLIAHFGVGGLLLVGALLVLVLSTRDLEERDQNEIAPPWAIDTARIDRALSVLALLSVALCLRMMTGVLTPDRVVFLGIGALVWIGVIVLVCRSTLRVRDASDATFALGGVLTLHALFDLGSASVVSTPMFALLSGAALHRRRPSRSRSVILGTGTLLAGSVTGLLAISPIRADTVLRDLGRDAGRFATLRERLEDGSLTRDELLAATGLDQQADRVEIVNAMNERETRARLDAIQSMLSNGGSMFSGRVERIAIEQMITVVPVLDGQEQRALAEELWQQCRLLLSESNTSKTTSDHVLVGSAVLELARIGYESGSGPPGWGRPDASFALSLWVRADDRTPHDPQIALRIMDLALQMGEQAVAARYAREAIARSDRMAFDPLKQLPEDQLQRARSVLGGSP